MLENSSIFSSSYWVNYESIKKITNFILEKVLKEVQILKFHTFGRYMY